jgi:site-specific recombinase XerD
MAICVGHHPATIGGDAMAHRLPPEVYSDSTRTALARAAGRGRIGARNRALLAVLYDAGLRVSEALALQPHDVDDLGDGARLHVRCGKGGKQRVAVLRPEGAAALRAWIAARPAGGPLFCAQDGAPLSTSAIRKLLPRIARRAGVSQRVHAHGFRHSHAISLLDAGVPVPYIQRQLGHASLATTETYFSNISPRAVEAAVLKS